MILRDVHKGRNVEMVLIRKFDLFDDAQAWVCDLRWEGEGRSIHGNNIVFFTLADTPDGKKSTHPAFMIMSEEQLFGDLGQSWAQAVSPSTVVTKWPWLHDIEVTQSTRMEILAAHS